MILAAGMDARSYRLPWREDATVFEVDQPHVIAIKDERLAGEQPRCRRVAVGVDLAEDWPKVLQAQGFDLPQPDGLADRRAVAVPRRTQMSSDCSPASTRSRRPARCCSTTSSGRHCSRRRSLRPRWRTWKSSAHHGFSAATHRRPLPRTTAGPQRVTDMAVPGHKWKRWAHPPVPADVPNAPRGYFVEAIKA